jgi:hypothetical protein
MKRRYRHDLGAVSIGTQVISKVSSPKVNQDFSGSLAVKGFRGISSSLRSVRYSTVPDLFKNPGDPPGLLNRVNKISLLWTSVHCAVNPKF